MALALLEGLTQMHNLSFSHLLVQGDLAAFISYVQDNERPLEVGFFVAWDFGFVWSWGVCLSGFLVPQPLGLGGAISLEVYVGNHIFLSLFFLCSLYGMWYLTSFWHYTVLLWRTSHLSCTFLIHDTMNLFMINDLLNNSEKIWGNIKVISSNGWYVILFYKVYHTCNLMKDITMLMV